MNNHRKKTMGSRRALLKRAALLAGAAVVSKMGASAEAFAQQKATKAAVKYQDKPDGDRKCGNCLQFVPGGTPSAQGTCKIVEGSVSPEGYCTAWVKLAEPRA